MGFAGADDAGVAGDGIFDVGVALGNLAGDAFEEFAAVGGVQQDDGSSLVVVHFGVILGDSPVVAQGDVGDAGQLAVTAFGAGVVLANVAQEQTHVFRTVMMLPAGSLTGVLRPGPGAGSRGTKPWRHPTVSPPRGPSAGYERPSRPYGLRSLTRHADPIYFHTFFRNTSRNRRS